MNRYPAPPFDLFNVYFERIYDPTMHLLLAFDGQIDEEVLRTATLRVIAANPYLGCRFAEGEGMPVWEEIAEEERGRGFVVLPPGAVMPPPPLDVRKGPQVRIGLCREEEGDLVVVTCHHGFCDARGLMDLAREIFAAYREIGNDPDFQPRTTGLYDRSTDPVRSRFSEEECRRAIEEEEPFVDRWRFPVERTGRGTPRIASLTLPPERLGRTRAFGKRYGATVNDVMIAAFFLAFLRIRDDPTDLNAPRSVLTAADLRRHLDGPVPPANLSAAYEVTLTAGAGARLEDVIEQVAAATRHRKAGALGLGCILFYEEIYGGGMERVEAFFEGMMRGYLATGLKNPVFSNLGIIDETEILPLKGKDGKMLDLSDARCLPCICWPYGFLMTLSTFREAMTLVIGYEEGPYSTDTVERFLEYVDEYLP
ncbi:condensation protein [Methanofollis fontis]|uniref:Condensation protein n=1 Tax=Methanofollis fontis TaxID=2052832 RepID=A0A483CRI9_9EURY|nr:condensation protein [Methanofollis fontis]TAJ45733.1 condensation protein [Methanofollis fontis]